MSLARQIARVDNPRSFGTNLYWSTSVRPYRIRSLLSWQSVFPRAGGDTRTSALNDLCGSDLRLGCTDRSEQISTHVDYEVRADLIKF